jgi:hypothetical protein
MRWCSPADVMARAGAMCVLISPCRFSRPIGGKLCLMCSPQRCPVACRTDSRGLWRLSRFEHYRHRPFRCVLAAYARVPPLGGSVPWADKTIPVCFVLARGRSAARRTSITAEVLPRAFTLQWAVRRWLE